MLINPHRQKELIVSFPGTRLLQETFGIVGVQTYDPMDPRRIWTVQGLYAPVVGRVLGGVRAKVTDQKGFVSFINQRDLELLLDLGSPGSYCYWLDQEYPEPGSRAWFGFCVDEDDLNDDMFDRELDIRCGLDPGTVLPSGLQIIRRIHSGPGNDFEETLMLFADATIDGYGPDTRLETIENRWKSIERTPQHIRDKLWKSL